MNEVELIERVALRVGMKSLMNHGAASCVYSEGCNGVTQEHLIAFAREIAIHCVAALAAPSPTAEQERPPYCGSGHCSCIECPYGAPPTEHEVKP